MGLWKKRHFIFGLDCGWSFEERSTGDYQSYHGYVYDADHVLYFRLFYSFIPEIKRRNHFFDIQAKEILKVRDSLNQILSEHTGQPIEKIREDTERDYFMTAEESKEYGIIDKIITTREMQDQLTKKK